MAREGIEELLRSLRGLAEVDLYQFREDPGLAAGYQLAVENTMAAALGLDDPTWRLVYTREHLTCGKSHCWVSWGETQARYGLGPFLGDCKCFAAAHAALLCLARPDATVFVGIRPGRRIAHAVAGIMFPQSAETIVQDPCVPAGMPPLHNYSGIRWIQVMR
jgi:hypothetical protein